MQDSEEQSAKMVQESHARLQECESQFASAMREAEAQIAEQALAEEHMTHQLQEAQMVHSCLLQQHYSASRKMIWQQTKSARP